MTLFCHGICDIGQRRKSNQDSIYVSPEKKFFMVADGMGGHNGGDIASQMAVKILPETLYQNLEEMEPPHALLKSYKTINAAIYRHAEEKADLKGMGTTIISILFKNDNLYISNIGDSRCYLINQKRIYQLSKDHSLIQEKINLGIYTREKAAKDSMKNVLVRTVGFDSDVEADIFTYKVCRHDCFLLCSDGLHGAVSERDILHIINQNIPNPETATQEQVKAATEHLILQANRNGGPDNVSAVLVLAR